MARTRSKGPASPKTPLSDKIKKIKTKTDVEPSPSINKVQKGKVGKNSTKSSGKGSNAKQNKNAVEPSTVEPARIDNKVATGAINELKKYLEKEDKPNKLELFDEEDNQDVYLQLTTKKYYSSKPNFKPKVIRLSNSIFQRDSTEEFKTCLIVRDQLITSESQVESIENEGISTLKKILTLKDIKTEYKAFEKRRQLYNDYDLFLVDDAILNSIPHTLGKVFYNNGNKKIPLPIRVTSTSSPKEFSINTFKNQLDKCLTSTFFLPPVGVNVSVKFGVINKCSIDELVENLQDVLKVFDFNSLRSIMIKTLNSPALPLFYNDKIYDDSDIVEDVNTNKKSATSNDDKLSAFERGLLEIGDADEVSKVVGNKLKQKLKKQSSN